ncbi:MAG: hypothetical protein H0W88_06655 [Parachlamydiaceae bacterium]|nr:hypothetical protein [Parachlamydiaceae bacterium]
MLSKIVGSLKCAIEFSPKNTWNTLSPLNKLIFKVATVIFAALTLSYFVIKKLTSAQNDSTEETTPNLDNKEDDSNKLPKQQSQTSPQQQTQLQPQLKPQQPAQLQPLAQEPKQETSTKKNKEALKEHSKDVVSKSPENDDKNTSTVTVLSTAKKDGIKPPVEVVQNLQTDEPKKTKQASVDQTSTKTTEITTPVIVPKQTENASKQSSVHKEAPQETIPAKNEVVTPVVKKELKHEEVIKNHVDELQKLKKMRLEINLDWEQYDDDECEKFMKVPQYSRKEVEYFEDCGEFRKGNSLLKKLLAVNDSNINQEKLEHREYLIKLIGIENYHEECIVERISSLNSWNSESIDLCRHLIHQIKESAFFRGLAGPETRLDNPIALEKIRKNLEFQINDILNSPEKSFDDYAEYMRIHQCDSVKINFQRKFNALNTDDKNKMFTAQEIIDLQEIFKIGELFEKFPKGAQYVSSKPATAQLDAEQTAFIEDIKNLKKLREFPFHFNPNNANQLRDLFTNPSDAVKHYIEQCKEFCKKENLISKVVNHHRFDHFGADNCKECFFINVVANFDRKKEFEENMQNLRTQRLALDINVKDFGAVDKLMNKDTHTKAELDYIADCAPMIKKENFFTFILQTANIFLYDDVQAKELAITLVGVDDYREMLFAETFNNYYEWTQTLLGSCLDEVNELSDIAVGNGWGKTTDKNSFFMLGVQHKLEETISDDSITDKQQEFIQSCQQFKTKYFKRYKSLTDEDKNTKFEDNHLALQAICYIGDLSKKL